jgi:F-type H+-transporting ATPase subunit a
MAGGGDIVWTSLIPGYNKLEEIGVPKDFDPAHPPHPAYHISGGILIFMLLIVLAVVGTRKIKATPQEFTDEDLIPDDKLSISNVMEILVGGIAKVMEDSMGEVWPRFLHLIGALALFILFCNLMGLVPGFLPPTESINTTAACALIVFFASHYYGFKEHGLAYLKHFMGPFWWLAPLMAPIEIISHLARPLSLSLRLAGNIVGDHKVGVIFFGLVALGVPLFALFLGLFVSFIQTFVFSLLAMVYISGAIAHEH